MKTDPLQLCVGEDYAGSRLDRYVAAETDLSRNQVQILNDSGGIEVDGRSRPDSFVLRGGEIVSVTPALLIPDGLDERGEPTSQDIRLDVTFEDDSIIVVNKAAGMVVHPAHGNWDGTVVNALLGRRTVLASTGGPDRPGIVHRLDKDTSGLMVVAKTDAAYKGLAGSIKRHEFHKTYHAIAIGRIGRSHVTIDAPIARHPNRRQQMAVVPVTGRPARTEVFVVDTYEHFDYIRVTTFTGRTHQIRVHLAHIGHPLLGDPVYGGRRQRGRVVRNGSGESSDLNAVLSRQALHASQLAFEHPESGEMMTFTTALPSDMCTALETIYREDHLKEV